MARSISETSAAEQLEQAAPPPRRRRGRARRGEQTEARPARRITAELGNIFERLRGSTTEVELSRYDERDDMPAFLRNVPSATFSREWTKNMYGGGKFQAIGLDVSGRAVARADFRIEGAPRYPTDPAAAAAPSSDGAFRPGDAVTAMMMNAMNLNTAMTKAVTEMFAQKEKSQPAPRDPVDDFIKINTALRAAAPTNDGIGPMAKTMRELAALGAELGGGKRGLAEAIVDATAPLAESLTEGIRDHLAEKKRAAAAERSPVVGRIPRSTESTPGAENPPATEEPVSVQTQLRTYVQSQLPILAHKSRLGVSGGDAAVTFFRQLYEITDLRDWPEVQTFAANELVIQGLRNELLNAKVPGEWAEEFLTTAMRLIKEQRAEEDDEEEDELEEVPAAAPVETPPTTSKGKGKGKK